MDATNIHDDPMWVSVYNLLVSELRGCLAEGLLLEGVVSDLTAALFEEFAIQTYFKSDGDS